MAASLKITAENRTTSPALHSLGERASPDRARPLVRSNSLKNTIATATLVWALGSGAASAANITINSIVDGWSGAVGGYNVVYNNSANPGYDSVRWGKDVGNGRSRYYWDSRNTGASGFTVATDTIFSLGTFTHDNRRIGLGTSITSVNLDFELGTFDFATKLSTTFVFGHQETPNSAPCALESNSTCDDYVTLKDAPIDQAIQYNGKTYYFSLLGFGETALELPEGVLQTAEGEQTSAKLYAIIRETPVSVPDGGATLALLGGALVGLGALRRRFGR